MIADFLPHFSGGLAIWALLCALDGTTQMRSHAVVIVAWIAIAVELIQGVAGIGDMARSVGAQVETLDFGDNDIYQDLERQERRIQYGICSGELNRWEARQLPEQQHRIRHLAREAEARRRGACLYARKTKSSSIASGLSVQSQRPYFPRHRCHVARLGPVFPYVSPR